MLYSSYIATITMLIISENNIRIVYNDMYDLGLFCLWHIGLVQHLIHRTCVESCFFGKDQCRG